MLLLLLLLLLLLHLLLISIIVISLAFAHRTRFQRFASKFSFLVPRRKSQAAAQNESEQCQQILESLVRTVHRSKLDLLIGAWVLGKRHVFHRYFLCVHVRIILVVLTPFNKLPFYIGQSSVIQAESNFRTLFQSHNVHVDWTLDRDWLCSHVSVICCV